MNRLQRLFTIFTLSVFLFGHVAAPFAYAAPEAPLAPSAPAPEAPSAPEAPKPEAPKTPEAPSPDDDDEDEPEKTPEPTKAPSSTPAPTATPASTQTASATPKPTSTTQPTSSSGTVSPTPLPSGDQSGQQTASGQSGTTDLETGDATNNAGVTNTGNMNSQTLAPTNGESAGQVSSGPSVGIANTGNGSGSTNTGAASVGSTTTTNQQNSAQVANNVNQSTVTGQNEASKNTGGDTNLTTGDANTTGTIINNLNTNASGIAVAEFNVEDDQIGDIVLDFATGCISDCGPGSVNLANSGNGAESTNSANLDVNSENNTFQSNDADIENNLVLVADSGNNDASKNTGGDTSIQTGDANVSANVLTFANNNVAGDIVYTVVNVFGDLIGDIIMPKEYIEAAGGCLECGGGDINLANSGNGAGSDNTLNVDQATADSTFQSNDANIENNLIVDATTAGNSASANTNGDNNIQTGDTNVDANILNVANANVAGGVWWLVLVNEAGNWVGRIVGSPDGSTMAGSEGTEFTVNDQGEVVAVNSGNGAGSTNNADANINETNTTVQENTANVVNNVNLTANTGKNTANKNTGGDTSIQSGDANVVANIVNFVNNNITAGGKLFVTVVNVFGAWQGNFITPDATKEEIAEADVTPDSELTRGGPQEEIVEEELTEEENQVQEESAGAEKKKKVKKSTQSDDSEVVAAAGASDTDGKSGGVLGAAGTSLSQVAGLKIGPNIELPDGAVIGSTKTKINLAWLVFALPLLALIALSRMRIAYYTRRLRNKLEGQRVEGVLLGSLIAACIYVLNRAG